MSVLTLNTAAVAEPEPGHHILPEPWPKSYYDVAQASTGMLNINGCKKYNINPFQFNSLEFQQFTSIQ
jgi:hypothetical protein